MKIDRVMAKKSKWIPKWIPTDICLYRAPMELKIKHLPMLKHSLSCIGTCHNDGSSEMQFLSEYS